MPRKNKRKFFFGKNKKSKAAKLQNQDEVIEQQQHQQQQHDDSESEEEEDEEENEKRGKLHKSAVHASISSVTNDSALELGLDSNSQLSLTEVTKMGTTSSSSTTSRWRSEPILNISDAKENRKATITLKVIQFIPKAERANQDTQNFIDNVRDENDDNDDNHKSNSDTVISVEQIVPSSSLHVASEIGNVPKLDHNQNEDRRIRRHFDDNYRVESPTNQQIDSRNKRRHAMLIQEISESSSSEEVKQFLDAEASALEVKSEILPVKVYQVDSPEESSNDDDINRCSKQETQNSNSLVQEICESSSNESVKNEILASILKQPPPSTSTTTSVEQPGKIVTLKIINIRELPTEELPMSDVKITPSSPTMMMKGKTIEKKLNKAEEAIMEALYGNPNLLQIPNTPLDVISEEGSDCSDIERHSKINQVDIDGDDDVFLPPSATMNNMKPAESATSSKFRHRRRVMTAAPPPPVEQPTMLINTRIIETESNVPESFKTWETMEGDSELQAELVYLPSTSSSATDLSERSGEVTDPDDEIEDTSEDTETNSLLENISVPSFFTTTSLQQHQQQHDMTLQQYQENEQQLLLLPDISEGEEEEQSQKSLEIIESQQQIIEDVNKELHHLIACEHKEVRKEDDEKINEQQSIEKTNFIVDDKKLITTTTDNQNVSRTATSSNSGTPTQFRRKYSSDSSSSSANSQCTIIRQLMPIENTSVHALKDLCMQSLQASNNNDSGTINNSQAKITVQKKFNSISRNAPNIPIISELEMQLNDDHRTSRENKVITILQVPPDISKISSEINHSAGERERWYGVPSTQMPNLVLALSPMQKKNYMQDDEQQQQQPPTSADVLLDMHKKFIERRAYHENSDDDENSDNSRLAKVLRQQKQEEEKEKDEENDKIQSADHFNGCGGGDVEMKIETRDSPTKVPKEFEIKKVELEHELKQLAYEQQELEEELKNLQSLQHFKREEFLFNQKKFEDELQSQKPITQLINSNEQLHQEIYNEWQDKVNERNERKLQKSLKITTVDDSLSPETRSERAASEKFVPLREEFISKVKERQKRLSLPIDDNHNWDGSTESLLNEDDDEKTNFRKKKKKLHHVENNRKDFPAHFREFLDYCEQEIVESKNSIESGESKVKKSLLLGLIGVASLCVCGFFVWKNSPKFS